jgi:hypothetical protein
MNYTFIILGIIVAVLIYVLYLYFSDDSTKLFEYQDLQKSAINVPADKINYNGQKYAYGFWIYVNNYSGGKTLLQRIKPADSSSYEPSLKVYLPGSTPTLKVDIETTASSEPTETIDVTNNFPIQKWVHVVVSKEGQIVDVYIDGKLVKSHMLSGTPEDIDIAEQLSSSAFSAFMARLKIWKHGLNPQTVYDEYMKGNGQSGMITGYGVDVSVLRDNIEQTKFSLL